MQRTDLENQIHDYIESLYNATYNGLLEVREDNGIYTLVIGLPSYMSPTTISVDSNSDQYFLDFIFEEFRTRNYLRLDIYKVTREELKDY